MDHDFVVAKAIESVNKSQMAYCKFLSANDSGETGGHQAGILISIKAIEILFGDKSSLTYIAERPVKIKWQDDIVTDSKFKYYESKKELRITTLGRGFPYLNKEDTGALFVLIKQDRENYEAYFLYTEEDIAEFLDYFGISSTETNRIFWPGLSCIPIAAAKREAHEMTVFMSKYNMSNRDSFPSSYTMSHAAQEIYDKVYNNNDRKETDPDQRILDWTEQEYRLFRRIEKMFFENQVKSGFKDIESFINMANQILNRRKSRAGKSLEHHMAAIFDANGVIYDAQVKTEGNKKPDFIFPSGEAYHNIYFPVDKIVSLASKTTCKDRWRQVINEADRLRDKDKYLVTLQQGISSAQLKEMEAERVVLVVPKPYITCYPPEFREKIWTIKKFIEYVKELEL